jgi:hypothetical protein
MTVTSALLRAAGAVTGTGFSPLSIAGLKLWFEADQVLWQDSARSTLAVADGDPVGAWDDASVSAKHATQATSTKRGTLKTNIFGTRPAVRFDGVDDFLKTASMTLNAPCTEFHVGIQRTDPAGSVGVVEGTVVGPPEWANYWDGATNKLSAYAGTVLLGSVLPAIGTAYINVVTFTAGVGSKVRLNGGAGVTGNIGATNPSGATLGAHPSGTNCANVDLAAVLFYDTILSNVDLDRVGNYLAAKYGTTWAAVS